MADRNTTNGNTSPKPNGPDYLDEYAGHIGALYDNSLLPLTSVGGTADTITAAVDPELPSAGLVTGMKFTITWGASNTGPATLQITGASAVDIVGKDGAALLANQLESGARDLLEYDGTNFILVSGGADITAENTGVTVYTISDLWINNLPPETLMKVEGVGPGAGGASGGSLGGAGGAYDCEFFRAGDLPGTVPITIASGGAVNADGGETSFGTFLVVAGGKSTPTPIGGRLGPNQDIFVPDKSGGDGADSGNPAGDAVRGGAGGGAAAPYQAGGQSQYAGNGGDDGVGGSDPGGGGGRNAPGGRGEIRITVF